MQTAVRHKAELEGDPLRHIQPVQFVMKECRQTTIKFLCVADYSVRVGISGNSDTGAAPAV